MSELTLAILKKMDRSDSIFCTIKLIFQSLKMIDSIKKSDDRIHNPDHSASWQDGECDLLIFWYFRSLKQIDHDRIAFVDLLKRSNRSHQSFKKIEHERINLIKRLDLFHDRSIFWSLKTINLIVKLDDWIPNPGVLMLCHVCVIFLFEQTTAQIYYPPSYHSLN